MPSSGKPPLDPFVLSLDDCSEEERIALKKSDAQLFSFTSSRLVISAVSDLMA